MPCGYDDSITSLCMSSGNCFAVCVHVMTCQRMSCGSCFVIHVHVMTPMLHVCACPVEAAL